MTQAANVKVNRVVTKTVISAVSETDFDDNVATALQALGESQLVNTHFAYYDGTYVAVIFYIPA